MVDKLLPCPFCGGAPYACTYDSGKTRYAHEANGCIMERRFVEGEAEEARWNRRTTPLTTEGGQAGGDYPDDPHSLKQMLHQRDKWIVENGNWQAFANALAYLRAEHAKESRQGQIFPTGDSPALRFRTPTFAFGDKVRKRSGSWWEGRVVGFYCTDQTPDGVCVQLEKPQGPVQIYPANALELVP